MARIHTLEDDITFERVRNLPKRTRVCSIHRQLSWACQKEIQLYAKDSRVTTSHIERSKTALQGRYRELAKMQHKIKKNTAEEYKRRASCPEVLIKGEQTTGNGGGILGEIIASSSDKKQSDSVVDKNTTGKGLPRSVSMYESISVGDRERADDAQHKIQNVPKLQRQQTIST